MKLALVRNLLRSLRALFYHLIRAFKKTHEPYYRTRHLLSSLGTAFLLISACQRLDDRPAPPQHATDLHLRAEIEPRPLPNEYQVHLYWSLGENPVAWSIKRTAERDHTEIATTLPGEKRDYVDPSVNAGESYVYTITAQSIMPPLTGQKAAVTLFSDLEIKGRMFYQDLSPTPQLSVHRLFLIKGSQLVTNGAAVQITAHEIHSDGGTIRTFPYGQTAGAGMIGHPGGRIQIEAHFGTGVLYVVAQGENGGTGLLGIKGKKGPPGPPGRNGECGYRGTDIKCEEVARQTLDLWRRWAQFGPNPDYYRELVSRFFCRVPTGDGFPGGQGERGSDGGRGGNGGDSGEIFVRIADASQIEVKPSVYPGDGGNGGPWGDGGDGGTEGVPGRPDRLALCSPANFGTPGPRGPIGAWGEKGGKGKPQTYCLSLGSHLVGDCELRPQ